MQLLSKIPVTAVIFSLNEAANIAECIYSLSEFESVVVIDSGSSDGTLEITMRLKNVNNINDEPLAISKKFAPRIRSVINCAAKAPINNF